MKKTKEFLIKLVTEYPFYTLVALSAALVLLLVFDAVYEYDLLLIPQITCFWTMVFTFLSKFGIYIPMHINHRKATAKELERFCEICKVLAIIGLPLSVISILGIVIAIHF